jgi:hypothetical protein
VHIRKVITLLIAGIMAGAGIAISLGSVAAGTATAHGGRGEVQNWRDTRRWLAEHGHGQWRGLPSWRSAVLAV